MALLPFETSEECRKCGWRDIRIRYMSNDVTFFSLFGDLLECKCRRCGYVWRVMCKDHIPIKEPTKREIERIEP